MDRTLVRKETASLYVRYQRELGEATLVDLVRVLGWVGRYTLGVLDAPTVAQKVARSLEGCDETSLAARCDDWFVRMVAEHVCDAARASVRAHRERGDVVAIVTGATRYAATPVARHLGIDHVVASELEVDARGRFTGRFQEPLCFGAGKIARLESLSEAEGIDLGASVFYSDSLTDLPLLERVGEPVAVNPDPRLKRIAQRRGWRIERW